MTERGGHEQVPDMQQHSVEELRQAMIAAREAMLDLGPMMADLNRAGASEAQKIEFQHLYGVALQRHGKLRQELIAAGVDPDQDIKPHVIQELGHGILTQLDESEALTTTPSSKPRRSIVGWLTGF